MHESAESAVSWHGRWRWQSAAWARLASMVQISMGLAVIEASVRTSVSSHMRVITKVYHRAGKRRMEVSPNVTFSRQARVFGSQNIGHGFAKTGEEKLDGHRQEQQAHQSADDVDAGNAQQTQHEFGAAEYPKTD